MMNTKPTYPVYIISKGRADCCLTAQMFEKDGVDYNLVVEPQEADLYRSYHPNATLHILPFSNLGLGSIPARNWVWEHAKESGVKRHWIFDDNIRQCRRFFRGKRLYCNAKYALKAIEDFTDRYENIGIAGMNYSTFVIDAKNPFTLNAHVYSAMLIDNALEQRWRGRYNEDTDLCLQVLVSGLCTVLFNAFMIDKQGTMTMKGGNTAELYQGDGRLKMARSLERAWPYTVETKRRFKRPQHVVRNAWRNFDTQLIRRKDIDWDSLGENEYGMKLVQRSDEVKSDDLRKLLDESNGLTRKKVEKETLDSGSENATIKIYEYAITNSQSLSLPKYPIYIPSRGRAETISTAKVLQDAGLNFHVVVEPQDHNSYSKSFGDRVIVMDKNDQGIAYVRNFCKDHAKQSGADYHWQIDDNIKSFGIRNDDKNKIVDPKKVFSIVEYVVDNLDGVGAAGIKHQAFAFAEKNEIGFNRQVYTCMLLSTNPEVKFRAGVIEDTDYNLQLLFAGYSTILFNRLIMNKITSMAMSGGNTEISYENGGRDLRATGMLEAWPDIFTLKQSKNGPRIAPSRIWSSFVQRPKEKVGV